jgi:hypothetical protein
MAFGVCVSVHPALKLRPLSYRIVGKLAD